MKINEGYCPRLLIEEIWSLALSNLRSAHIYSQGFLHFPFTAKIVNKYDHLPWAIFDMLIFILKDSCTLKHIDMRENDVKIWNWLHCESMIYDVWRSVILSIQNLCDVGWLFAIVNHFRGLAWMCAPYLFVFVLGFQTWFVLLSSSMAPSSRPGRGSWKHGSSWQHPLRLRI